MRYHLAAAFCLSLVPNAAIAIPLSAPSEQKVDARDHRVIQLIVDQDRIDGSMKRLKGSIKETFGKVTGDRKTQAAGKREKTIGKVQNGFGRIKDDVRGIIGK